MCGDRQGQNKFDSFQNFSYYTGVKEMIDLIKLDYTIESPEERKALVEKILEENPNPSESYLEILADYLILCMEKQEKKERKILTENRLSTVNKRECSFEGLVSQLENGEDGIYNLIKEDKNVIFQPKISITKHDLETIPLLKQLRDTIEEWEKALKHTSGRDAYIMKKALIEMRKDQYLIKQGYQKPLVFSKAVHNSINYISLDDTSYLDEDKNVVVQGISLMDSKVVSAILCNYSKLKEDSYENFEADTWYLIQDFENICDKALINEPLYMRIVECKIDKMQNIDIQTTIQQEFGIKHSLEYISSLWRNKIPKLIAQEAENEFIKFEFKKQNLPFKKCSRCGQNKPAHNNFFSLNNTSKDGFNSICKACRNKKKG